MRIFEGGFPRDRTSISSVNAKGVARPLKGLMQVYFISRRTRLLGFEERCSRSSAPRIDTRKACTMSFAESDKGCSNLGLSI